MEKEEFPDSSSRNEGLLEAIDFFSQKFDTEQLSSYAIDFVGNLLGIRKLCLFTEKNQEFHLLKKIGYSMEEYSIKNSEKLQHLATFCGSIMVTGFDAYFEKKDIKALNMGFLFPLIIQDRLHGFLVSTPNAVKHLGKEKALLAHALMQIINNALENSDSHLLLLERKKKLDREVFNLFSINQSSKALLSVLDLNSLYQLAIDIFSEMTSSGVTSFGLYDEISGKIVIRGYKNIFSGKSMALNFDLVQKEYSGYQIVFHRERDREKLEAIFGNCRDFELLEAEYIILMVRESILGFVTIGKTINETEYDDSVFELIESLASATYISFKNAMFFNEISRQKAIAEQKYNTLVKLNRLMKNLNSCETLEELCDLAGNTIHIGFGIKKTLLALYEGASVCRIKSAFGFTPGSRELKITAGLKKISEKGPLVEYFEKNTARILGKALAKDIGGGNCLVVVPIRMALSSLEEEQQILGYIMAFETKEALKEEEVLLLDTISNSISPTIYHMKTRDRVLIEHLPDQRRLFLEALKKRIEDRESYLLDFYLYGKRIHYRPLEEPDLSDYTLFETYFFDGILILLSDEPVEGFAFEAEAMPKTMEEACQLVQSL